MHSKIFGAYLWTYWYGNAGYLLWRQRFLHYYNRYYLFKLTVLLNNTGHILQWSTIVKLVAFVFFHHVFALYCIKENGLNQGVTCLDWKRSSGWMDSWEGLVGLEYCCPSQNSNQPDDLLQSRYYIALIHGPFQWVASHVFTAAYPTSQAQLQLLRKCDVWIMTFPRSSTQDGWKSALRETTYNSTLSSQHWN